MNPMTFKDALAMTARRISELFKKFVNPDLILPICLAIYLCCVAVVEIWFDRPFFP